MISTAWMHFRGLGPVRIAALNQCGIKTWHDAVNEPERISATLRDEVIAECESCLAALDRGDLGFFTDRFDPADRHLILTEFSDVASYFDIETTGLEYDDSITVIACWHQGQMHSFVEGENLDDFLDLLDEIQLLVSFNGSTFDVPRVLDTFHIPELPCPHLDLRWACHHRGLTGGLKQATVSLGLQRPSDLVDADGALAVRLWQRWRHQKDEHARQLLIRYCAADVLLLQPLAEYLANKPMSDLATLWDHLPERTGHEEVPSSEGVRRQVLASMFGSASPARLRTRRRKLG